jgi:heterodisulfide reductase subunit C/nitrate reductase gamma subunit
MCIYAGFILLLLMHAMDKLVTESLFENYYATLNPFLFLRNFLGLVVLLGLILAIGRRFFSSPPRPKSTTMDYYALSILAVIMLSGVLLESTKILSNTVYEEMVTDYAGLEEEDTDQLYALNAYWVQYYGVVSPNVTGPFDEKILQEGKELHEGTCMECHSRPQWAFMSYGVSRIIQPLASPLDRAGLHTGLWYLHILACFLGLAYLPFSKFFHIFSTPVFLLTKGVMKEGRSDPANMATFQVIEMDACVHCGDCTRRCSVAVALNEIPNPRILPSEKHAAFRSLLSGRNLSKKKLMAIQEGSYICTDCHRCTDVCPIGIQMESLWRNLKQHVADLGYPKPEAWARQTIGSDFVIRKFGDESLSPSFEDKEFTLDLSSLPSVHTFSLCFGCQNCTNVCPVVAAHDSPRKSLGLLPHEIMHCLALRQKDLVLGSMMLWDCLTCYLCQEQCPQNVCVTDILYKLKNMALNRLKQEA